MQVLSNPIAQVAMSSNIKNLLQKNIDRIGDLIDVQFTSSSFDESGCFWLKDSNNNLYKLYAATSGFGLMLVSKYSSVCWFLDGNDF